MRQLDNKVLDNRGLLASYTLSNHIKLSHPTNTCFDLTIGLIHLEKKTHTQKMLSVFCERKQVGRLFHLTSLLYTAILTRYFRYAIIVIVITIVPPTFPPSVHLAPSHILHHSYSPKM